MAELCYQVPESTIYRKVSEELVLIQLDTGKFYYFNPETEAFLDFFKAPRSLSTEDPDLHTFVEFLLQNKILKKTKPLDSTDSDGFPEGKPALLREGEKNLDEITFLCP